MRVYIDFSVFTPLTAVGNVHGCLELAVVPREGELLSFLHPRADVLPIQATGFTYQIQVKHVIHSPQSTSEQVALSLADVTLETTQDAKRVMQYFVDGFGLYADEYEPA